MLLQIWCYLPSLTPDGTLEQLAVCLDKQVFKNQKWKIYSKHTLNNSVARWCLTLTVICSLLFALVLSASEKDWHDFDSLLRNLQTNIINYYETSSSQWSFIFCLTIIIYQPFTSSFCLKVLPDISEERH